MQTNTVAAARILRFLEREPVVWLSTVRPDGGPHLVPVWFWWDGAALLIFSKPEARKVRNMRADPRVMLALGDAEDDFDVGLIRGRADLLAARTVDVLPPAFVAKYAARIAALRLSAAQFAATYSQVVRIVPDAFLGWHGRTRPQSARVAGAPAVSIEETRRSNEAGAAGEPVSRRRPRERRAHRIGQPAGTQPLLRHRLSGPLARGLRDLRRGLGWPVVGTRSSLSGEPSLVGA